MSGDIDAIRQYVTAFDTVSFHAVQKEFSLSYAQVRRVFAELAEKGIVSYDSGFSYKVNKPHIMARHGVQTKARKLDEVDINDALLLRAIWNCVLTDNVSASGVQRSLSISYDSAYRLVEKMDELGLIDYQARKVLITAEEYIERFGAALGLT
ncbi:MAG: hypothetical protein K2I75_05975 [Clostridiales bacterium]|nr:hypothetical protein [Clostridiales bacterium]